MEENIYYFKKRIQLPKYYKHIYEEIKNKENYNLRFIGVYHYQGFIIFVDFVKDTYLNKKMNNSAAHVYINDLYQSVKNRGIFKKVDSNENTIYVIKKDRFKDYLDKKEEYNNDLIEIFINFNKDFFSQEYLTAEKAISEMYNNKFNKWKEVEWAGWFLEYKFNKYINENNLQNKLKYIGSFNKKEGDFDFDLWFDLEKFYGDLKASDINRKEAPANDQINFLECINQYEKFWYIIYEHNTIKDIDLNNDYEATRWRSNFIKEKDLKNFKTDLSYYKRMKYSVNFCKMSILELNRFNYREILSDFNQGRQQNGDLRKKKFKINKNNIDNFIIFRYNNEI